jgi:DNA-binding NarL/FixJ family response regulator
MNPPLTVAIADGDAGIRHHLHRLVMSDGRLHLIGAASNSVEIIALCHRQAPAIILLDVSMSGAVAPEVVTAILEVAPATRIIIVSAEVEDAHLLRLSVMPIWGYVLKHEVVDLLLQAIHQVAEGHHWYSPALRFQQGED